MTVKFHIGFIIGAETLFELVSKMLPIEDLHVEEIIPQTPTSFNVRELARANSKLEPKLVSAPKLKPKRNHRGNGKGVDLKAGVNAIIMRVLADGTAHRGFEFKRAIGAKGYAESGIGSRLDKLAAHGFIVHEGPGLWRLATPQKSGETVT